MMWNEVVARIIQVVKDDPGLALIYAGQIRATGTGDFVVPSLEWMLVGDAENELWAPMTVQFDQWVREPDSLTQSEFRLRALFHKDLPISIDSILLWAQYLEGTSLPVPDRSGVLGRSLRFRFTPLRSKYALPQHNGEVIGEGGLLGSFVG